MEEALTSGARVGAYEIESRLGAGGMGEVYRARDTRLGRTVALKVLRVGADPELLHRLDREARAASGLNHPNIVHIYDVGEAASGSGAHYVVMEYVDGETLRKRLARGPLPLADVLSLAAQAADGLAKAHRAGIVHRDLKPENLMVTADGQLKIVDFGLAKVIVPLGDIDARETMSQHATRAGMLVGTLEYMSPEQATGRPVDHRTDQFALGAILHEMLAGRPPFRRDSPAQVLAAVIERDPQPLSQLRADVPAALDTLVQRCLRKDPEARYARTDELATELAQLAGRSRVGSLADAPPPLPAPSRPAPVSVEVLPSTPAVYHVEVENKVKTYDEAELADRIRRGKLTGLEMARRDDEEQWQPLFESRVYRREVPGGSDPRQAARRRVMRGLTGHFSGFFVTLTVMWILTGQFPWWILFWGVGLAMHVVRAAPMLWTLARHPAREIAAAPPAGELGAREPVTALPAPRAAASGVEQEAARVRVLIEQRGGPDAKRLLAEVDGILKLVGDLATREADLEEQTSDRERSSIRNAITSAEERIQRSELEQDRRLFERQVEVLRAHEEAIDKAVRVLERLRVRRQVAEHQLKQLRLDLSRGAASGLDVPELSSRLQFIRYEVDAREEVEEIRQGGA